MSDLDIAVKQKMIEVLGNIMMENYTSDEIAEEWLDLIGCGLCPYDDRCLDQDRQCDELLLENILEDIRKEGA